MDQSNNCNMGRIKSVGTTIAFVLISFTLFAQANSGVVTANNGSTNSTVVVEVADSVTFVSVYSTGVSTYTVGVDPSGDFVVAEGTSLTNSPLFKIKSTGKLALSTGVLILSGSGAPSDNSPPTGSLYLRTDGSTSTTLYIKTGPTTWTAK